MTESKRERILNFLFALCKTQEMPGSKRLYTVIYGRENPVFSPDTAHYGPFTDAVTMDLGSCGLTGSIGND